MKTFNILVLLLLLTIIGPSLAQEKNIPELLQEIAFVDQKVMIPMRDGVRLRKCQF